MNDDRDRRDFLDDLLRRAADDISDSDEEALEDLLMESPEAMQQVREMMMLRRTLHACLSRPDNQQGVVRLREMLLQRCSKTRPTTIRPDDTLVRIVTEYVSRFPDPQHTLGTWLTNVHANRNASSHRIRDWFRMPSYALSAAVATALVLVCLGVWLYSGPGTISIEDVEPLALGQLASLLDTSENLRAITDNGTYASYSPFVETMGPEGPDETEVGPYRSVVALIASDDHGKTIFHSAGIIVSTSPGILVANSACPKDPLAAVLSVAQDGSVTVERSFLLLSTTISENSDLGLSLLFAPALTEIGGVLSADISPHVESATQVCTLLSIQEKKTPVYSTKVTIETATDGTISPASPRDRGVLDVYSHGSVLFGEDGRLVGFVNYGRSGLARITSASVVSQYLEDQRSRIAAVTEPPLLPKKCELTGAIELVAPDANFPGRVTVHPEDSGDYSVSIDTNGDGTTDLSLNSRHVGLLRIGQWPSSDGE